MLSTSPKAYCFVPGCLSKVASTPNKLFFCVPKTDNRNQRFKAVNRNLLTSKTQFWCCEDHFEVRITVLYCIVVVKSRSIIYFRLC